MSVTQPHGCLPVSVGLCRTAHQCPQDDGNLAVYGPSCNTLTETGRLAATALAQPPCLTSKIGVCRRLCAARARASADFAAAAVLKSRSDTIYTRLV